VKDGSTGATNCVLLHEPDHGTLDDQHLSVSKPRLREAFEGLELGEGKLSRPVLRGPGGRKAAWLFGYSVM